MNGLHRQHVLMGNCAEKEHGGDVRAFAKTIGLNERQAAKAVSRVADALASSLDAGLGDSLVSDEFASGFVRLVRANLDRIA